MYTLHIYIVRSRYWLSAKLGPQCRQPPKLLWRDSVRERERERQRERKRERERPVVATGSAACVRCVSAALDDVDLT